VARVAVLRPLLDLRVRRKAVVGVAVATEAVSHTHGHMLGDDVQTLDLTVAGLAFDAPVHVGPVIEVHMVWK